MKKRFSARCFALAALAAVSFVVGGCSNPSGSSGSKSSGDKSTTETVSLALQSGKITAGSAGTVTFGVTTASVADGTTGTISWYGSSTGTSATTAPTGVSATVSAISNGAATVTIAATASASAGSYYFKLTEDSAVSSMGTITIDASSSTSGSGTSNWSTWFNSATITSKSPLSLSYDSTTDTATVTVASIAGETANGDLNASYDLGSITKGTYLVSFTAWTDGSSYALSAGLQKTTADYTIFGSSDISLTNKPTAYSTTVNVTNSCAAHALFMCATQTGTFHVKGLKVSVIPSTLVMPSITAAYDGVASKTTISFPAITDAKYLYLYESTTNTPSTATLLCIYNQATGHWDCKTRKQAWSTSIDFALSASGFTVSGYSAAGTYYYWISGQKDNESESDISAAASVSVSGDFSNYTCVPTNADCRSLGDTWGFTITTIGTDTPQFFYAAAGTKISLKDASSGSAVVGVKIYLAATAPSTYLVGSSDTYNYVWQTTTQNVTVPTSGYYVIERYNSAIGSYHLYVGVNTASTSAVNRNK
jgi:hypothetical protein